MLEFRQIAPPANRSRRFQSIDQPDMAEARHIDAEKLTASERTRFCSASAASPDSSSLVRASVEPPMRLLWDERDYQLSLLQLRILFGQNGFRLGRNIFGRTGHHGRTKISVRGSSFSDTRGADEKLKLPARRYMLGLTGSFFAPRTGRTRGCCRRLVR